MELFLVRAHISKRRYMHDKDEVFEDIRIVQAVDEYAASDKYTAYWEGKNSAYDVSYWVCIEAVTEMIS